MARRGGRNGLGRSLRIEIDDFGYGSPLVYDLEHLYSSTSIRLANTFITPSLTMPGPLLP